MAAGQARRTLRQRGGQPGQVRVCQVNTDCITIECKECAKRKLVLLLLVSIEFIIHQDIENIERY